MNFKNFLLRLKFHKNVWLCIFELAEQGRKLLQNIVETAAVP